MTSAIPATSRVWNRKNARRNKPVTEAVLRRRPIVRKTSIMMKEARNKYYLIALAIFLTAGSNAVAQQTPGPDGPRKDGSFEKYGTTATGVDLYWSAFVPAD